MTMKSIISVVFSLLLLNIALSLGAEQKPAVDDGCNEKGPKINIDVYYSADGEVSKLLILKELVPLWTQLQKCVNFSLKPIEKDVPKDNVSDNNKYHACVLHSNVTDLVKFQFVKCYMEKTDATSLDECAKQSGIPSVANCTTTKLGNTYLAGYLQEAEKTKPPVTYTPVVFVNDVLVPNDHKSLLKTICKINPGLSVCKRTKRSRRYHHKSRD